MKSLIIYFKAQKVQIPLSIFFIILPFLAVCLYLPFIPYMPHFFIIVLFLIKILVLDDSHYKKRIMPKVQSELAKELKKNPSSKEIYKRLQVHARSRDITLLMTGVIILCMAFGFERF